MHSRCARGAQELLTEVLLEHFLCFSVASFTSHFHFTLEPHTDDQKLTHLKCFYTEHKEALLCIVKEAGCAKNINKYIKSLGFLLSTVYVKNIAMSNKA